MNSIRYRLALLVLAAAVALTRGTQRLLARAIETTKTALPETGEPVAFETIEDLIAFAQRTNAACVEVHRGPYAITLAPREPEHLFAA